MTTTRPLRHRLAVLAAVLALLAAGVASAQTPPADAAPREKLVITDLEGQGLAASVVSSLTAVLCTHVATNQRQFNVLCADDVRAILEARDTALRLGQGDDARHLAEIGVALSARYVLSGSLGQVGDQVVIHLVVIDAQRGTPYARITHNVRNTERERGDLIAAMRSAATRLFQAGRTE